jgi:hypothetical protein
MEEERELAFESREISMMRFDSEELLALEVDNGTHDNMVMAFVESHKTIGKKTLEVCNMIEASAMCFVTGVADEHVAFPALACHFAIL